MSNMNIQWLMIKHAFNPILSMNNGPSENLRWSAGISEVPLLWKPQETRSTAATVPRYHNSAIKRRSRFIKCNQVPYIDTFLWIILYHYWLVTNSPCQLICFLRLIPFRPCWISDLQQAWLRLWGLRFGCYCQQLFSTAIIYYCSWLSMVSIYF